MKEAPCENYGCFYLTCITCSYGTNWCLRRQVLEKDWSRYYCCQGLSPCCQEQLDNVTPADPNGRACCAWCECCVCPGLAIAATRSHLMIEYGLTPDPSDNQIIRFNNCIQMLACICEICAMFNPDLREAADCIHCIAQIVFCCMAGCMAGQIDIEKRYQQSLGPASAPLLGPEAHDRDTAPGQAPEYRAVAHDGPTDSTPPPPPPCLLYTSPSPRDS
eukprot:TRINITY_DN2585_c0_g1_i16.p1 TRINITY_DN2585_c0_g1~~TRINITY_DN2585_c0_g1_i16.p1  ORF type:complete len:218 (+),score=29.83 TRINITY_DN2585_c0_g1_i16:184-837(+)